MSKKFEAMLSALGKITDDDNDETDDDPFAGIGDPEKLRAAYQLFGERHAFAPGQVVRWKRGMKHKRSKGPFIVMEVLETPVFDGETSAGTPYFREPLDVVLGSLDSDGDFVTFHYDSRRFEPV